MNTRLVRRSRSGSDPIWLRISLGVSEWVNPCFPVAQKRHPHAASRLRGDAERRPVAVGNVSRLHEGALPGSEKVFLRAVGRDIRTAGGLTSHLVTRCQTHTRGSRQIGHRIDGWGMAPVEPARHLPGGEAGQPLGGGKGPEFGGSHSVKRLQGAHERVCGTDRSRAKIDKK